jgi:hypothetical protein
MGHGSTSRDAREACTRTSVAVAAHSKNNQKRTIKPSNTHATSNNLPRTFCRSRPSWGTFSAALPVPASFSAVAALALLPGAFGRPRCSGPPRQLSKHSPRAAAHPPSRRVLHLRRLLPGWAGAHGGADLRPAPRAPEQNVRPAPRAPERPRPNGRAESPSGWAVTSPA